MGNRLPIALGAALLVLAFSFALPAHAQATPLKQPLWVTVNASAEGNYPGGNEQFTVFAVDAGDTTIPQNVTIDSMTLSAPFFSNTGPGLPATLLPGQSILVSIHLPIPANYSQPSFTASLMVHARIWNGTTNANVILTGIAIVNVFALPSSSTSQTTTSQAGGVSTTVFAAGVAIPSLVAVVLLALLVRAKGGPKPPVA